MNTSAINLHLLERFTCLIAFKSVVRPRQAVKSESHFARPCGRAAGVGGKTRVCARPAELTVTLQNDPQ